jgi:hypothetical protein
MIKINIGKYIRERNWIVALILLVIGFALLWGSTYFEQSSRNYILMMNLGAASIVTAIAMLILSHAVGGIETTLEKEINELTSKLDVLPEAKKCGIVHIFESRRKDPSYKKELIKQFEDISEGEEVLLMSNSLRDFFGPRLDNDYLAVIFGMLKKGIKFKILLLDPTSDAAKDRARVEEKERVESNGYINSTLFTEIKSVVERLNNPSSDLVVDEELIKRIKEQIEVRFFPYDPTTQLIITEKFVFIEQYHRGGDKEIRKALEKEGNPFIDCFGGFVPVWMVENSTFFAKLIKSHFTNIWNSDGVNQRDLRKNNYYQEILRFEKNEKK